MLLDGTTNSRKRVYASVGPSVGPIRLLNDGPSGSMVVASYGRVYKLLGKQTLFLGFSDFFHDGQNHWKIVKYYDACICIMQSTCDLKFKFLLHYLCSIHWSLHPPPFHFFMQVFPLLYLLIEFWQVVESRRARVPISFHSNYDEYY